MAFTLITPYNYRYLLATQEINFETDSFKAYLCTSSLTYDPATMVEWADVSAYLINNTNASAIRLREQSLVKASEGVHKITGTQNLSLPFDSLVLDPDEGEDLPDFQYVVIIDDTVTDDPIVTVIDFGENISILGGETSQLDNMYLKL